MCKIQCLLLLTSETRDNPTWANFGEPWCCWWSWLCALSWCCGGVVCPSKTSQCVRSKRHRVCRHHAHMLKHVCAWCRHTRGRFECTNGYVLDGHTGFFSVSHHTTLHTQQDTRHNTPRPPTRPRPQQQPPQQHTETETERDRERRQRKREKRR